MAVKRKYPVGIQGFEGLRKDGYIYVDKTPLIYKMVTQALEQIERKGYAEKYLLDGRKVSFQ